MKKKEKKTFLISGPSGAGKGEIVDAVLNYFPKAKRVFSTTTRMPREGDRYYRYLSKKEFEKKEKEGEFLETNIYKGNNERYGTLKDDYHKALEKSVFAIKDLDVNGVFQLKEEIKNAIYIFILPRGNEFTRKVEEREEKRIAKNRIKHASWEISHTHHYDYVVVNEYGKLKKTISEVVSIIKGELDKK